ncbi:hypothetical protein [Paraprevotella xylaniphila]|uniref:hypothetical protein n=1 Tax=Paraprevotella xylaniphila TaxID=454155 RepID=UPI001032EDDB|nr:hypothetical protein [Paraprevotella xylaniphila]
MPESQNSLPLHRVFHSIRFKVNKGWVRALTLFFMPYGEALKNQDTEAPYLHRLSILRNHLTHNKIEIHIERQKNLRQTIFHSPENDFSFGAERKNILRKVNPHTL